MRKLTRLVSAACGAALGLALAMGCGTDAARGGNANGNGNPDGNGNGNGNGVQVACTLPPSLTHCVGDATCVQQFGTGYFCDMDAFGTSGCSDCKTYGPPGCRCEYVECYSDNVRGHCAPVPTCDGNTNGNTNAGGDACAPCGITPCPTCHAQLPTLYVNGNFDGWRTAYDWSGGRPGGKTMWLTAPGTWQACLTVADPAALAGTPGVLQFKFDTDDNLGADTVPMMSLHACWSDPAHADPQQAAAAPFSSTYQLSSKDAQGAISVAVPAANAVFKLTIHEGSSTYDVARVQ